MKTQTATVKRKKDHRDLSPYAGRWIAFVNHEVKAAAQSLPVLMQELKKKTLLKRLL